MQKRLVGLVIGCLVGVFLAAAWPTTAQSIPLILGFGRTTGGVNVPLLVDASGALATTGGGGGGGICGSDGQIQFNDMGACGADAGLTFDKTTKILSIVGDVPAVGSTIVIGSGADYANTIAGSTSGFGAIVIGTGDYLDFTTGSAASNVTVIGQNSGLVDVADGYGMSMVGNDNYIYTIATNAGYSHLFGDDNGIGLLDVGSGITLLGAGNTALGLGDGGTITSSFMAGVGNTITVTDATSSIDDAMIIGSGNSAVVPTGEGWNGEIVLGRQNTIGASDTVAVGNYNTLNFGGASTFGNHLTPTATNQTWFGDVSNGHPVFIASGDSAIVRFTGNAAPTLSSVDGPSGGGNGVAMTLRSTDAVDDGMSTPADGGNLNLQVGTAVNGGTDGALTINGTPGISASGGSCTITAIDHGFITGGSCS